MLQIDTLDENLPEPSYLEVHEVDDLLIGECGLPPEYEDTLRMTHQRIFCNHSK